jgi:hypothetical protein
MVSRLTVTLEPEERTALERLCEADVRPPQWAVRHLILSEAKRRGLLDPTKDNGAGVRQDIPRAAVPA